MSREVIKENNLYYTVIKGTFRTRVDEFAEGAVRREYETKDGAMAFKYERILSSLIGYIEEVQFYDSEFGMQCYITLDRNEKGQKPIIQLSMDGREADNFLKKLPNIDLNREVCLRPFNFKGREGDEVRGLDVSQEDENGKFKAKVSNYFWDEEKEETIHGYPRPDGNTDDFSKDDWKIYFLQVRKFLINYTHANVEEKIAKSVELRRETGEEVKPRVQSDEAVDKETAEYKRAHGEDEEPPF